MGLSPEQVAIHNAETVAFCIGAVTAQLKVTANRLALRPGMYTEVGQLIQAVQDLAELQRNVLHSVTHNGRE